MLLAMISFPMSFRSSVECVLFCLWSATGALAQEPTAKTATQQIEQVLADQARAWNQGNIEGFMEGYAKLPTLCFASGGTVTHGWQETLDRYRKHYPDHSTMGVLTFADLETTILAPDAAVVFGHWQLQAENGSPGGLFTLVLRRTKAGWQIVADHTSAATPVH